MLTLGNSASCGSSILHGFRILGIEQLYRVVSENRSGSTILLEDYKFKVGEPTLNISRLSERFLLTRCSYEEIFYPNERPHALRQYEIDERHLIIPFLPQLFDKNTKIWNSQTPHKPSKYYQYKNIASNFSSFHSNYNAAKTIQRCRTAEAKRK